MTLLDATLEGLHMIEVALRGRLCDECLAKVEPCTEVELDAGRADHNLCRSCWRALEADEHDAEDLNEVLRAELCDCELGINRPCPHSPE